MKLDALGYWVIVEKGTSGGVTPGGIILPDNMKDGYVQIGTVVSVGEMKSKRNQEKVVVGARVLYHAFIENEVLKGKMEKDTISLKEEDLVAIVSD